MAIRCKPQVQPADADRPRSDSGIPIARESDMHVFLKGSKDQRNTRISHSGSKAH